MVQNNKDAMRSLPKLLDIIDLTQDSPMTTRNIGSRTVCNVAKKSTSRNRIVKRNNPCETASNTTAYDNVTSINETINLDDTTLKDDDKHYAVASNGGELMSLQCPICLESLSSELKPTTTKCGHVFCAQCIEKHVLVSKKCPTCNSNITLKSCTRLFL